ncbi:MAG: anti-sigma factor [Actinomycetota bacterium]|nr:anti-sigma factor [Actinomycetota bacterium]
MSWDHDRVEELLAAHALDGLDGDDAALAERALIEHLPECDRCRRAWDGYRAVASDLALAAAPAPTSELLDARIRAEVTGERRPSRGTGPLVAATAGVIAVLVGLSGFSVLRTTQLDDRLAQAEQDQSSVLGALSTVVHPAHETVQLSGPGEEAAALYYVPGQPQGYLMAANLPPPRHTYHVWFVDDGEAWHAGTLRVRGGRGVLPCRTDPERWDAVVLTDEPGRPSPRNSPVVSATVSPGA